MPADPKVHRIWAVALTAVAIGSLVLVALFVRSLLQLPGRALESGKEVAVELFDLASAFREGTVETTFASDAARLAGGNKLQVAELSQLEIFTRTETDSVLWGTLRLPDVVVEARVPVEYVYYLDLAEPWRFVLEDQRLRVEAPALSFNSPALDVSRLEYQVRSASLLRDEDDAIAALQSGLSELARERAQDQVGLIRETARRYTSEFVENWLVNAFEAEDVFQVEVVFADEPAPGEGATLATSTEGRN